MFDPSQLDDISRREASWQHGSFDEAMHSITLGGDRAAPAAGLTTKPLYSPLDTAHLDYLNDLGFPGEYPYTRGIQPTMYLGRLWTMRQYAGYGTVEETNHRFKHLLQHGMAGINVAFDLPTQLGYDPDHPRAEGEVGNVGISCSTLKDMEILFDGIPLLQASPSFAINAPAQVILAMYLAVAERQGLSMEQLSGTTQNDILKEFIARGNYIFPPAPSVRLTVDIFEWCSRHMPRWNFVNVCGYHMREAGATLVQEVAFALADAITYVEAAQQRGLDVDAFAPRLAFNFAVFTNLLEEVAKFRAARRLWARIMKDKFHARRQASLMLRTGAGSGGSTLTAQQPENNIVRVAIHCLAAALGGVQCMHSASMDEALALPSEKAAMIALRTQQIVAYESGVADVIDPLGGSYYVEALTDRIEEEVTAYLNKIEKVGGMIKAIETGWAQREIAEQAYRYQKEIQQEQRVIVGVNRFREEAHQLPEAHRASPDVVQRIKTELRQLRNKRDNGAVKRALARLQDAARTTENLVAPTMDAVKVYATIGEICDVLRQAFGEYEGYGIL